MNGCGYQQKSSEGRSMVMVDSMSMVCPKPRRLGLLNPSLNDPFRPLRLPINHQTEMGDSKAGAELLDIILTKGGCGGERSSYQVPSSPPFYCGSPPSRASNPVIQDAQFGNEKIIPIPSSPGPLSPSARKGGGGCVRMTLGHKPAAVRIEGFDCLSRDRRNCSISAVA
ncbi:uncharacterized protein LOC8271821 isoform X2 [Ricinus communis]|uniref:Uncharacterized protein n=2 Tax=Ricinus communis TaxID=3988 RepID=B9T1N1_RICCO|nr:uncharacterized protein LOC8271821 isoform X2 [Ricinus communis]EEF30224.1 conserved hypothetical protein [Ricinus communis]|eukprot:XP_002532150.1 uncharacterized protein LOC8271821 isoform X2 [Ricinus communis]